MIALTSDIDFIAVKSKQNTTTCIGDSICDVVGNYRRVAGFMEYFAGASNGAVKLVSNKGYTGHTSAQMAARFVADIGPSTARSVLIMCEAANDIGANVSVIAHRATIISMVEAAIDMGKRPILVGAPPRTGYDISGYMIADQVTADIYGVPFVNPWFECTAAGGWLDATYSFDGVHPTHKAARIAGQRLWSQLSGEFTGSADVPLSNTDPVGMLSNCLFATNSGGVPTGWYGGTASGTVAHSVVAATLPGAGNVWRMVATSMAAGAANSGRDNVSLPGTWAAGDVVRLMCRITTDGYEAAGSAGLSSNAGQGKIGVGVLATWDTGETIDIPAVSADVTAALFSRDGVVPAGATKCSFRVYITATATVSGTADIGELQLRNLSLAERF